VLLCALDAYSFGQSIYSCGFGIRAGVVGEICGGTRGSGGLEWVHVDRGGGGIFLDRDRGGGVFLSGKARAGERFGRVSGFRRGDVWLRREASRQDALAGRSPSRLR
jgi:hypothetical protein